MKHNKLIAVLVVLLTLTFIISGCGDGSEVDTEDVAETDEETGVDDEVEVEDEPTGEVEVELSLSDTNPVGHVLLRATDNFAEELESRSNGAVEVIRYRHRELYDEFGQYDAVEAGTLDMAVHSGVMIGQVSSVLEFISGFNTLGLYDDWEHYYRVMDNPRIQELAEQEFERMNQKLLGIVSYGSSLCVSTAPIHEPADFEGLRVIAGGEPQSRMFAAMGGTPVEMAMTEMYMALERGTVDASGTGAGFAYNNAIYEVAPNIIFFNDAPMTSFFFAINKDTYDSLSSEHQELILELSEEMVEYTRTGAVADDEEDTQLLIEAGANVIFWEEEQKEELREITYPIMLDIFNNRVGEELTAELFEILEEERL